MADTEMKMISENNLVRLIKNDIMVGETLVAYVNTVNQEFMQRVEMLSVNDSRRKVVALLAFLVRKTGNKNKLCHLDISLTQQGMADMCGLTRESASRQLMYLKKSGLIVGNNSNLIIDTNKLNKVVNKLGIVI